MGHFILNLCQYVNEQVFIVGYAALGMRQTEHTTWFHQRFRRQPKE
jgi:hypothetical protein